MTAILYFGVGNLMYFVLIWYSEEESYWNCICIEDERKCKHISKVKSGTDSETKVYDNETKIYI